MRYSRHLIIPDVAMAGQKRMKNAKVLAVGAGGLGSPTLMYLAAAGVGTLGVVDFDVVDESNLQRQIIHGQSDIGKSKARSAKESIAETNPLVDVVVHGEASLGRRKTDSAAERLRDLNTDIVVTTHDERLTSANALDLIGSYDVIVDGSDNFPTRYLVNDACVLTGRPLVYAAIFRFEGQASVFAEPDGPCYRCLYPEPPPPGLVPSCAEAGVLGVLPGVLGCIQALEAIKLLAGIGETLTGRLLVFDALRLRFRELALQKDPDCPVCGSHPTVRQLVDYEAFCGLGQPAGHGDEISVRELSDWLGREATPFVLDVREPHEWEIASLAGATLIPLATLPARLAELDPSRPIVTMCHKGMRSMRALQLLKAAGFADVRSLAGGIDAWAREVAPDMPRY
jgi:adenylyltransferase/sulfurtransferase